MLVLRLQIRTGTPPDVGREIEFALGRPGGSVEWVGPEVLRETIADPKLRTRDVGGTASTSEFTAGVVRNLR